MKIDPKAFEKLFEESTGPYDLAENFSFFVDGLLYGCEDHLESLRELPPLVRKVYLAMSAQVNIEGNGFQSYLSKFTETDLQNDTVEGFRILGFNVSADAYYEALNYIPFHSKEILYIIDSRSSEIHSAFYSQLNGSTFWDVIGNFIINAKGVFLDK